MARRCLLSYIPSVPFDWWALTPQRSLAVWAAGLRAAGMDAEVHDFGSVEALRAFEPEAWRQALQRESRLDAHGAAGLFQARRMSALHLRLRQRWAEHTASWLESASQDAAILLYVCTSADFDLTRRVALLLRARAPERPLILAGPWIDLFWQHLLPSSDCFSYLCRKPSVESLAALLRAADAPERALRTPGVMRPGERPTHELRVAEPPQPQPDYSEEAYPACREGKLMHFEVEHSRGFVLGAYGCPESHWNGYPLRLRQLDQVCAEVQAIQRLSEGGASLHFTGEATPTRDVLGLSCVLAGFGGVLHSRESHFDVCGVGGGDVLAGGGLKAAQFTLDTGSQYLLERFYGHGFTVSGVESVVRTLAEHGVACGLTLTYPCPQDDYHTRDETLRLLRRLSPAAMRVVFPLVAPGSLWRQHPRQFGFRVESRRSVRAAASADAGVWWRGRSGCAAGYRMQGWLLSQAWRAQQELCREAAALGVAVGLDARQLVVAAGAECARFECVYWEQWRRALEGLDIAAVERLVEQHNSALRARQGGRHAIPAAAAFAVGN